MLHMRTHYSRVQLLPHVGEFSVSVRQVILLVTFLFHMNILVLFMSDFVLFTRLNNSAILLHYIQQVILYIT